VLRGLTRKAGSPRGRVLRGPGALVVLLLGVLVVVSSACGSSLSPASGATSASARVTEFRSIADLQDRFNRDAGKVRLILLISPT
jgi:hypothetical protein